VGYWKKATRKDIEALLGEFHAAGWKIVDPPTYYRVTCPCGTHLRWIHLTPSGAGYVRDTLKWLYRQPCYKGSTS
jgi:hypothetical protein